MLCCAVCGYARSSLEVKIETDSNDPMEIKREVDSNDIVDCSHHDHPYAGTSLSAVSHAVSSTFVCT